MIKKLIWVSVSVAALALVIGIGSSAQAGDEWFVLGEKTIKAVDHGVDIEATGKRRERKVKKVKVSVEQADVEITKLVFHYKIRRDDELANLGVVKAGGQITPVDVPGRKAQLKSVTIEYKILGGKETAAIKVWGFD